MDFWAEFREHFDTDDGSLPELQFVGLSDDHRIASAAQLDRLGGEYDLTVHGAKICKKSGELIPVSSMEHGSRLIIVDHKDAYLHCTLPSPVFRGAVLPELGVWIARDFFALYYRMGKEWNPTSTLGFLRLIKQLLILAPEASLKLDTFMTPDAFLTFWSRFCASDISN